MKIESIGKLFKLPSASVVRVTREFTEDGLVLVAAVYVGNFDLSMKILHCRKDWFDAYAVLMR